jgi:PleD family two-component response regulator
LTATIRLSPFSSTAAFNQAGTAVAKLKKLEWMTEMHSVLLVDDDCDSLSALKLVFEVHNCHVAVAEHGGAALTEVKKHLPDLVV